MKITTTSFLLCCLTVSLSWTDFSSNASAQNKPGTLLWEKELYTRDVHIGCDGNLYYTESENHNIICLSGKTGKTQWVRQNLKGSIGFHSQTAYTNPMATGTVYVVRSLGAGNRLYDPVSFCALDARTGDTKWVGTPTKPAMHMVATNGNIYYCQLDEGRVTQDSRIGQLNKKDGKKMWETTYSESAAIRHGMPLPQFGPTKTQQRWYFDNFKSTVFLDTNSKPVRSSISRLDRRTGAESWTFQGSRQLVPSHINADEILFCINRHYNEPPSSLLALDGLTGVKKWGYTVPGKVSFGWKGTNGTIYVCVRLPQKAGQETKPGTIFAIDEKTGKTKWKAILPSPELVPFHWSKQGCSWVGSDNTIYVRSSHRGDQIEVCALDIDNRRTLFVDGKKESTLRVKWRIWTPYRYMSRGPMIGTGGILYLLTRSIRGESIIQAIATGGRSFQDRELEQATNIRREIKKTLTTFNGATQVDTLSALDNLAKTHNATGHSFQEILYAKAYVYLKDEKKTQAKTLLLEAKKIDPQSRVGKLVDKVIARFLE